MDQRHVRQYRLHRTALVGTHGRPYLRLLRPVYRSLVAFSDQYRRILARMVRPLRLRFYIGRKLPFSMESESGTHELRISTMVRFDRRIQSPLGTVCISGFAHCELCKSVIIADKPPISGCLPATKDLDNAPFHHQFLRTSRRFQRLSALDWLPASQSIYRTRPVGANI